MNGRAIREMLNTKGLKATPVRKAILLVMKDIRKPITAEILFSRLSKGDKATVYRNLKTLEEAGLIKRIDIRSTSVHYELADLPHHHHLVCMKCGLVEDIKGCTADTMIKAMEHKSKHFSIIKDHAFELFGICKTCS